MYMTTIRPVVVILILSVFFSCGSGSYDVNEVVEVYESYEELEALIDSDPGQLWVINFWATTCPPCLKEMPHFAELEEQNKDRNFKVLLVSLDDKNKLDSRVLPFIKKHQITPEVKLLADQNYTAWTDEIDPSWFGALPATIMINGEKRNFKFGAYESYDDLLHDFNSMKE